MYDIHQINSYLKDDNIYTMLDDYCQLLAAKYQETFEGKYRIKYNDLFVVLHGNLSDEKLVEFFNSFATSLDIYPIQSISLAGISLIFF